MRIKQIREDKGISQTELADKLKIQRSTLSRYESGKLKPNSEILIQIAKILNVDIDMLFDDFQTTDMLSNAELKVRITEGIAKFSKEQLKKVLILVENLKNNGK